MNGHRPLLLIIDGHALAFRAFHALREAGLRASTGEPTYAIYGFISILLNAIQKYHPMYVAVSFDVGRTFRDDMYAEYKAGRSETPDEFHQQLDRVKELLDAFNIPIYVAKGFEADDVIGTLSRQATSHNVDTLILTGDTDTLQLVDSHVRVLLANPYGRQTTQVYDEAQVTERYKGLAPNQLADLRGLKGDTSDNIPGVKGIGEAGAIALLNQFGTVENLYANLQDAPKRYQKHLEGQEEAALFSKKIATIVCDVPVKLDLAATTLSDYDRAKVIALFQKLEFGATMVKQLPSTGSLATADLPDTEPQPTDTLALPEAPAPAPASSSSPQQMQMFDAADAGTGRAAALTSLPTPERPALGVYEAVRTEEQFRALLTELSAAPAFAFDTEADGLRPLESTLVGISLAVRPGAAWYIPIGHRDEPQLPRNLVLNALRPFFADPQRPKYAHNAKFDVELLEVADVPVHGVTFDTMLAASLLDKRKGLKDLAFYELTLPEPMTPIEDLIGKGKNQILFGDVPIDKATPYAAADADMTLQLVHALEPQLAALGKVNEIFRKLEMPLLPVLVRMEEQGIGIDGTYMRDLGRTMGERLETLADEIFAYNDRMPFNINSGTQLSDVLFGKVGLSPDGLEKTKTGQYSLTALALEALRDRHPDEPQYQLIDLILQHRQLTKLKSTYVDALPTLINQRTGRVHTSFSQLGAATGRLSSSDPNLQNIPTRTEEGRAIRRGFVAKPGHQFIAADYSQIELRVLAHITQDPNLNQAFQEGQDIHTATAAQLFNVAPEAVTKNQRRIAKTTVFGVIYGISSFGLAARTDLSRSEAQALIDALFARFPGLREYINRTLDEGAKLGYVQSLFGRRRGVPDIRVKGPRRQAAEREAINAPIQATAADIMKIAMIRVDEALRRTNMRTKLLLQVHDELILEAPDDEVAAAAKLVRHEMENAYTDLRVPLQADVEIGPNWLDMTDLERDD